MDSELITPQVMEFDIRGQICPATLLIALKELNRSKEQLHKGEVQLVFKTDNRDATITIPDAAENMGYAVSVQRVDDYYAIVVEQGH